MLDHLPELQNLIKKCVRCGQCRSVCPIFEEIGTEVAAPRAKVFLTQQLHKGEIEPSEKVLELLNNCLMCESCSKDCPSGIQVHKFVATARSYVMSKLGFNWKRVIYQDLWASPSILRGITWGMWVWQKTGLRNVANSLGLTKLLPGDLGEAEKMLTSVPFKSAQSRLPNVIAPKGKKKFKVVYFLGCATNLLMPNVAFSTVDVLTRNGCEVIIPENLKCCGIPQYGNGTGETALELAKHNIDVMLEKKPDYIISDCGTCTATLQHGYPDWFKNTPFAEKSNKFGSLVSDVSAFLINKTEINKDLAPIPYGTVSYHDSCHMSRGIKVTKEPREILKLIPGLNYVELQDADRCCGGAGSFCLTHYELSSKIVAKKARNIIATGAEVFSTSCPMCTMNITNGLRQNDYPLDVKHPMEFLSESYLRAEKAKAKIG